MMFPRLKRPHTLILASLIVAACSGDSDGTSDNSQNSDASDSSSPSDASDAQDSQTGENSVSTNDASNSQSTEDPSDSNTASTSEGDASTEDSSTTSSGETTDSTSTVDPGGGDFDDGTFIEGIKLTGIEFNQGSAIVVAEAGKPVEAAARDNELVRNRHALVRAIYTVDGWAGGEVEGRLLLSHADGSSEVLKQVFDVQADADLTTLGGTFEWRLDPEQVTPGMSYAMGLFKPGSTSPGGSADGVRIPTSETVELGVPDRLMRIEIVLVKADNTLEYTDENLKNMADVFYEHSPLEFGEIDISVRDAAVDGGGSLESCLQAVKQARSADKPDPHVYYLGLLTGNIGGLSDLADDSMQSASRRTSCNFNGQAGTWPWDSNQIAVHEVGHAAGSAHTPGCNAAGAVNDYPDLDDEGKARLGVWGYSVMQDKLYEPNAFGDIMCYCRPHWTGRYTYGKWTDRIATLSSWPQFYQMQGYAPKRQEVLWAIRGPETTRWWIAPDTLPEMPVSDDVQVSYADALAARRTLATAYVDTLADPEYQLIAVPLGEDLTGISELAIHAFGEDYYFADTQALRADYERVLSTAKR